ncbi:MAG: TonB-dependent receptor plug domain-containing protein [Pseudomonadales bacterium]
MSQMKFRKALGLATLSASMAIFPLSSATAEQELEEVVVTGSFIKGTPEDAALPVDVISRGDLEDVGNPSVMEMVRNLSVTNGNIGETNQFDTRGGQGNEGVTTANLRGLGSARTLVLINGKRHVATESIGVDISAIPSMAIGRVEVLKDGAAALYGSDAIAGVMNFITRDNFEGLEIRGSHQNIQDSDGDNSIGFIFGHRSDNIHFAISAEYDERDELPIKERSWALRSQPENPQGGWSGIGNPGRYLPAIGGTIIGAGGPDPQCELLGGAIVGPACQFQFTFFDNLIEEQETTKVFGELNIDINDSVSFHLEALYADMDMPSWKTSPSYPPQSLFGPDRIVPASHPGLIDMKAQNPTMFPDIDLTAAGLGVIPGAAQSAYTLTRMLGVAGRPGGEPEDGARFTETQRISGGFEGSFENGIGFDISLSWSDRERDLEGSDMFIERMAFALDGFGGPNCNQAAAIAAGTPGQGGCEYYNPFSNAIQRSAVTGAVNPQFNAAVANSDELIAWMTAQTASKAINELLVFEAIFNGETNWELDGGNVGWAAGFQTRSEEYDFTLADIANRAINPCPFVDPASITLGHTTTLNCGAGGAGRLAFLAASDEESTDRDIYGAFAEFALPLTETLDVQLAFRYEDYGDDDGGDSFDPKIAVSWAASDLIKVRGSASTTFRGPPGSFLGGTGTSLTFLAPASAFKAVDTSGNPNLDPETAVTLNLGVVFTGDNFYGSLDYWSFDLDPFQTESASQLITAYTANDCADGGTGIGSAACNDLRPRFTPLGTAPGGIQRVARNIINGADQQTSGFDFVARYTFYDVANGDLTIGTEGTYVLEFESDDFESINGTTLAPGGDFAGKLNDGDPTLPKPEVQAQFFAKWGNDRHRLNYAARYVSSYDDVRPAIPALDEIDSHVTHDIHYINNMFDAWTLSLSIINATDEDPPLASTDLSYDGYTHNPFGRMIKLGVVFTPELF